MKNFEKGTLWIQSVPVRSEYSCSELFPASYMCLSSDDGVISPRISFS